MTENQAKDIVKDGVRKGMCQFELIRVVACRNFWIALTLYILGLICTSYGGLAFMLWIALTDGTSSGLLMFVWVVINIVMLVLTLTEPFRIYCNTFARAAKSKNLESKYGG